MPAYKTFPFKGFGGGLNLRDAVDLADESQALDLRNVLFNTRGTVQQRGGYAKFTAAEGTNRYDSLAAFYTTGGVKQIVAGAGARLEALSTAGTIVGTPITTALASPHFFQRFGGPTGEHIYIANGTDTVRRWTGVAFETPTYAGVTPKGKFLGVSVTDNRLVNARFTGTVAGNNPSTVRFSAEGDPLTFDNDDYVDLTPGDGEEIMGIATWRDLVIVFKQTKFFVFYGNSVDDDGSPIFNYRPVDSGAGLVAPQAKAVSEQGIYFLDRTGIYFTAGSQPERVSAAVEPIFHGGSSVYYTGGELNDASIGQATMAYNDQRLWLSFPGGSSNINNRQLVFDPQEKWWTLFDLPAGPMTNFRPAAVEELVFGYSLGTKHLGRYVGGNYLADDMSQSSTGGNAITAWWQSGWFNYGTAAVKSIREARLSGSGLVTVQWYRDYRQTPAQSKQIEFSPMDTLYDTGVLYDSGALYGPSGAIAPKLMRRAIRGEAFSVRFFNNTINRSFNVHRLTTHIREIRVPSVVKVS